MTDKHIGQLGGLSGLLFVILFIPSYLSPPDSPGFTSTVQQCSTISPRAVTRSSPSTG